MKKISIILLFFCIRLTNSAQTDTLRVDLKEVTVSADRIISDNFAKYNFLSLITKKEFKKFQPWQLSDVLNNYSSVFIRDYGGLGGLKTISLRGLNSSQNILMINGVKLNSSQNMISDLSQISTNSFNEIEIVKGGNSAIFGAGAMGGVINLINRVKDNSFYTSLDYGSFNDKQIQLGYSDSSSLIKSSGNINFETSNGNYNFQIDKKTFTRKNSDFRKSSLNEIFETNFKNYNFSLMLNYTEIERGVPGPVIFDEKIKYSQARLNEYFGFGILKIDKQLNQNSYLTFTINLNRRNTNFFDNDFLGVNGEFNSNYINNDIGSVMKYLYWNSSTHFNINIEYNYSDLEADNGVIKDTKYYTRKNYALSSNIEFNVAESKIIILEGFAGLRFDHFSDIESTPSGFIGSICDFKSLPLSFKGNVSYNFRPPSFNELYYFNFGNINLNPEKSISFNFGLNYSLDSIKFELNGFYNRINNQIVSVPQNPVYWNAQNIQMVSAKGFEFIAKCNFFDNYHFSANFTFSSSRDISPNSLNYNEILVYSPEILSHFILFYNDGIIETGISLNYTGKSYYLPDNQEDFSIPAYMLIDFFAKYNFKLLSSDITINLNIKNLLNENYYVIKSYPMPGIIIRGGIYVEI